MPHKPNRIMLLIGADLPSGVTAAEFKSYAVREIRSGVGAFPPEYPLFDLNRDSVVGHLLNKDIQTLILLCRNGVLRRQVMACLRADPLLERYFN